MRKYLSDIKLDKNRIHVGLIGSGIQKSRSPAMHMREADAQGFLLNYQLFDLDRLNITVNALPELLDEIESAGFTGLNITHPCKQIVIDYLDELSNEASDLGAVNTVIFHDNGRKGYNTDWLGFYTSFSTGLPAVEINSLLQLGAGGAGSAVAYALAKKGVNELNIFDIDHPKAKQLTLRLADKFVDTDFNVLEKIDDLRTDIDGIINTTPVGMENYPGLPLPAGLLKPPRWVAEVIYFPLETALLKLARTSGCETLDGSGMAIYQAAEASRLFTGKVADINRMRQIFLKA